MLAVDETVNDPFVDVVAVRVGFFLIDDRLKVVMFLEVRVDVLFPVELFDDEVEVELLVFRNVLDEEIPRNRVVVGQRLEHAEDVGTPLRLVSADGTRSVKNARRNEPARARLQPIRFRQIENAVVALVPVLEALANLRFCRAGLESHEGVVETVFRRVELRGIVIGFRFAFLTGEFRVFVHLVDVMRERSEVVKEFGEDRPALVGFPNRVADDRAFSFVDSFNERKTLAGDTDVTQSFVFRASDVVGGRRAGEPSFVDAAAIEPERVPVGLGELDTTTRLAENARNPVRGQAQETAAFFHSLSEKSGNFAFRCDLRTTFRKH